MGNLVSKMKSNESNILFYGLTPPKSSHVHEKIKEISERRIERIREIDIDGLVVYDIQDEQSRIAEARPFPFLETVPSYTYVNDYMHELSVDKLVYLCVGKYTPEELRSVFDTIDPGYPLVFVGAPSPDEKVKTSLKDAYALFRESNRGLTLGAVTIAERHAELKDEHLRMKSKIEAGCSFFVSQCMYDVELFKNMLSDYYHMCLKEGIPMKPVIMTLTPCGSVRTMEFIKWLGVGIPRWFENDMSHVQDAVAYSLRICEENFRHVLKYARELQIPLGCNVESVAISKTEVLASLELVKKIHAIMEK